MKFIVSHVPKEYVYLYLWLRDYRISLFASEVSIDTSDFKSKYRYEINIDGINSIPTYRDTIYCLGCRNNKILIWSS